MIAKIFGFEKLANYRAIMLVFMRERAKFMKFYNAEPPESKEIKDPA